MRDDQKRFVDFLWECGAFKVGTFTLKGQVHGSATVTLDVTTTAGPTPTTRFTAASFEDYSDDGIHVINGTESVERLPTSTVTNLNLLWHSDLTASGCQEGTKVTSEPDGFRPTQSVLGNGLISTVVPINFDSCSDNAALGCGSWETYSSSLGFKSNHPGGAQFVMGDASVQFIPDAVDMLTYNRLGGKADGGEAPLP